jgi:hypothetical protein
MSAPCIRRQTNGSADESKAGTAGGCALSAMRRSCWMSVTGICLFGYGSTNVTFIPEFLTAVTGRPFAVDDMLQTPAYKAQNPPR